MATVNVSSASTSIAEEGLEQCKHCHGILRVHLSSVKECTKSPSCDSCVPCVDCLHKTPNSQHPPQLSSSSSMAMLSSSLLQSNSEMYGSMTDIQSSLSNIAQADDRRTGRKKKGTSIIHGTSSSSLMGSMNGSSGGGGILGSNNQLTSTLTRKISINEKDGSNNNATSPKKMSSVTASLVAANRLRRIAANNTNDSTNLVAAMNKEILHTAVNKELLSKTRASSVPVSSVPATSIGGDNTTLGRSATTHNTQIAAAAASSSSIKTPLITNTTADIAIQPTMVVTSPIIMVEEEENVGNDDHDEEDNDDKFPEMKFNPNDKTTNSRENLLTLRRVSTIKLKIGAGELEPPQRNSTNTATTHHHSMELLSEKLPVQRNKPSFEGEEELLGLHEPVIKGAAGRVKSPSVGNSLHLSDPNLLANVPGAQSNILPKPVALGYEMENKGSSGEKMFRSGDIGNSNGSNLNIDERGPIVIMTKAEVTSASITTNNERLSTATAAAASSSLQTPGGQSELKSANKNRFTRSFDNFMKSMKSSPSTSNLSQMDTPTTTTTPTNSSKQATADTAIKPTTTNPLSHGGDIAGGVETSTPSSNPVPINNNRLSFLNSPSSLSGSFSGSSSSGSPVKKGVGKMSRLGNASAPIMGFKSFKTTKEWYANFAAEVQQQIKYAVSKKGNGVFEECC